MLKSTEVEFYDPLIYPINWGGGGGGVIYYFPKLPVFQEDPHWGFCIYVCLSLPSVISSTIWIKLSCISQTQDHMDLPSCRLVCSIEWSCSGEFGDYLVQFYCFLLLIFNTIVWTNTYWSILLNQFIFSRLNFFSFNFYKHLYDWGIIRVGMNIFQSQFFYKKLLHGYCVENSYWYIWLN